jgi:hypothetical protein
MARRRLRLAALDQQWPEGRAPGRDTRDAAALLRLDRGRDDNHEHGKRAE